MAASLILARVRDQSFPAFAVYRSVTEERDWSRDSYFVHWRMRHPDGDAQALAMIRRHFRVPPANATPAAASPASAASAASEHEDGAALATRWSQQRLFDEYLYLTQAQQARCYETAFSRWRRDRGRPANTMGILYWQVIASQLPPKLSIATQVAS